MSAAGKVKAIIEALSRVYSEDIVEWWRKKGLTPLQFMMLAIISQKTRNDVALRAVFELSKVVSSPSDLLDPSREEVVRKVVERTGLVHRKVEALKGLATVLLRHGGLDNLLRLPWTKVREELMSVPGLGSKTVDVILMHLWRAPLMPVDTNILRVLKRVGLVDERDDIYRARERVEPLIPEDRRAWVHLALLDVGKKYCKPRRPRCTRCPLSALCDYARSRGERR